MTTFSRIGTSPAPGSRRITITDVARTAGVSIAVVSYALNGRPGVSDRTRRHVLRTAADLGWRPSAAARSLRSVPRSVSVQAVGVAAAARTTAVALGLRAALDDAEATPATDVVVDVAPDHDVGARDLEHAWTERRHGAFVVTGLHRDDPRTRLVADHGVPLVPLVPQQRGGMLGTAPGSVPGLVWFSGDAEERAARYLRELGHRRVALLVQDGHDDPSRLLLDALAGAGDGAHVVTEEIVYRTEEDAAARAARLLATANRPTAVVADGDVALLAVLEAARQRGLEVPWDLSVLALEDSPACRLVHPPATAVARSWAELGAAAAVLVRPLLGGQPPRDDDDDAPAAAARLVIRGSTAPVPA
ncbi:LacI family DNA-binding transcriptional regulator [Xylanimonas cellulosilytica]|uniref:LacI family DNA-binding transcriptional regulator n=1 Tax=Xylanimonas cellulosilytica TaxID=186189 RepID=UPI0002DC6B8A|nr:LacI family DNA-binding transcriptional regulator [Xylanimonas cellulosilytica]